MRHAYVVQLRIICYYDILLDRIKFRAWDWRPMGSATEKSKKSCNMLPNACAIFFSDQILDSYENFSLTSVPIFPDRYLIIIFIYIIVEYNCHRKKI